MPLDFLEITMSNLDTPKSHYQAEPQPQCEATEPALGQPQLHQTNWKPATINLR